MINGLIDGALARRKVILAVTLVLTVFGFYSYLTVPREAQPDITIPFIVIQVPFPGVSPEDSERLLVRPMERELQSLEGVKEMNGRAYEGAAVVTLEFDPSFDKDKALEDVRAKVDLARARFPPDALPPVIEEENISSDPVIGVVLSARRRNAPCSPPLARFRTAWKPFPTSSPSTWPAPARRCSKSPSIR